MFIKEKKYVTFSNNLKYLMNKHGKTRNDLCKDLNLNYTTVREWCNGTAFPRYEKVELLANYFDVNKSALLEENSQSLLNSGLRNNLILQKHIHDLAEDKEQEDFLINGLMLNPEHRKLLNEQAIYYLNKESEMENK